MDLPTFRFYRGELPLYESQLRAWIATGTLGFTRDAWLTAGGYPDRSMGEEVTLLRAVSEGGGRVAPIVNDGIYVYLRHAANSWRFYYDAERGPDGWSELAPPEFLPPEDLAFYRALVGPAG